VEPQFIRVIREKADTEILINVNSISKIVIKYAMRGDQPESVAYTCSLAEGVSNPQAFRIYTIFVGASEYRLRADPGSRVMQMLENFYKNAITD
jgi:hypothetical protein